MVQEYDVTTNNRGDITSMTGRGLNNTKMVYTINEQGFVSKWERFDQAGNRLIWAFYEDYDSSVTRTGRDLFPGIPVWIQNNIATLSFDQPIQNSGVWRLTTTYMATDAQGNYNGVIREVKTTAIFKAIREGYIYERHFTNTSGASGSAYYRYVNCEP